MMAHPRRFNLRNRRHQVAAITFRQAHRKQANVNKVNAGQSRDVKSRIREPEHEVRRKVAALVESTAFLMLQKKLNAYWGSDNNGN
ncbi:hypothetical protein IMF27_17175 [Pseudomonas sp. PCH199]|uniref:hypothetical protein n=1 Tax=unclassified Pseudomonas TaxID=196821 RepID=UPI000FFB6810|nr:MULTISPECIES: hypothetical protein [unclassified Pseudomonas]MCW8277182.1 hypothetical protein [Pseudomonas sp. PCH199]